MGCCWIGIERQDKGAEGHIFGGKKMNEFMTPRKQEMKFKDAVSRCHVRSAIYRKGDPTKVFTEEDLANINPGLRNLNKDKVGTIVPKRYWKNSMTRLEEQVSQPEQQFDDWKEYDPRDNDSCSLFMYND